MKSRVRSSLKKRISKHNKKVHGSIALLSIEKREEIYERKEAERKVSNNLLYEELLRLFSKK